MTRAEALALMEEYTASPSLRQHMLAVEAAMRAYASRYGEDPEPWGIVGLLHDFDYEKFPNNEHSPTDGHPAWGVRLLRERGLPDALCRAILGHATYSGVPRDTGRPGGPAPAATARPRRDGRRWASARCWGTSRSRSRAAAPRCPMAPDLRRSAMHTRASPLPPRACAGAARATRCTPPSRRGLRLGSSGLHVPPFRPQLGHEDGPELAGVVTRPGAVLGDEARGRGVRIEPGRREITVRQPRQTPVEPARHRHREPAFAPPDHVVGHEPARRFL